MAKHTINGFVTYTKEVWMDAPVIGFSTYDPSKYGAESIVVVSEHSIEVEVPDDFNPVPGLVASLKAKKDAVRVEFAARINEIEDQISKLTCIEHKPV